MLLAASESAVVKKPRDLSQRTVTLAHPACEVAGESMRASRRE
jgi:hypothetical protein